MEFTVKTSSSNVSVIPATRQSSKNAGQLKKQANIRVAAYCRVSTGDESQQTSYTNQKAFYTELIRSKEGWQFAGIYADEAISGTSRAHRDEFNRMMDDARHARIDYIVTKSISRFSRNTVDTLNCVRELRQQDPPVGIYFEKENIDTLDATGELILTILSALAQDESRSISDNIRWTFQKNFQAGIPQINLKRMLGYDKAADGTWVINSEQSVIVRYIFKHYVSGYSANKIANQLNQLNYRTVNGKRWSSSAVLTILRNEKYVGDLEMQKTITKDFLTHRSVINHGEAPKYYVRDHHMGIIDRMTWEKVQVMLCAKPSKENPSAVRLQKKKGPKRSPFYNLRCGAVLEETGEQCGEKLFRMTYTGSASGYSDERSLAATGGDISRYLEKYSYAYPIWRCRRKLGGQNCPSAILHECAIEQSFMEMLYALKRDYEVYGESSQICRLFQEAYAYIYQCMRVSSPSIQRMEMLDNKIKESEQNLQKTLDKQAAAASEIVAESNPESNLAYKKEETEASLYAELASELRHRIDEYREQKKKLESELGVPSIMRKNFDFFLRCLKGLPEVNEAGMKIRVNGMDAHGSPFCDLSQDAKTDMVNKLKRGDMTSNVLSQIEALPDYLQFDRSIYIAFITSGIIRGDVIEYTTNFGVKLTSTGNRRNLNSFIGFKKYREDGSVELLDAPYKVCGNSIQYRRYPRRRTKSDK